MRDDLYFRVGAGAVAALVVIFGTRLRFCGDVSLPPLPPKPAQTESTEHALFATSATPQAYEAFLKKDAATYGVPVMTPKEMGAKLAYRVDDSRQSLTPGESVERAGLRLSLSVGTADDDEKVAILEIHNPAGKAVAYQVQTRTNSKRCGDRGVVAHNAMIIPAKGTVRRSECPYFEGFRVAVTRVEVVEVGPLQAAYLNRIPPVFVGISPYVAAGHKPPSYEGICQLVISQSHRNSLEQGLITWRDLIDFFARHRCETYKFFNNYKYFDSDSARPLPVVPGG